MQPPVSGQAVYLTIDASLQRATAQALVAGLQRDHKTAGASVVLDPQSGEVLAMVILPGYDTNLFTHGISQANYDRLVMDPDRPLLNRAIAGQYAPGSTFKMVTATAGLQEGKITPQTMLGCPSDLSSGGWVYHNWASYNLGSMNHAKARAARGRVCAPQQSGGLSQVPARPDNVQAVGEGRRGEITRPDNWNYWFRAAGVPADGGGKTGTAQWGGRGLDLPTHAWFVFFAPYAQSEIALSVFVERGELSEVEAAPIGIDIMQFYLNSRSTIRAQ